MWERTTAGGGCRIRGECPPGYRLAQSFLGFKGILSKNSALLCVWFRDERTVPLSSALDLIIQCIRLFADISAPFTKHLHNLFLLDIFGSLGYTIVRRWRSKLALGVSLVVGLLSFSGHLRNIFIFLQIRGLYPQFLILVFTSGFYYIVGAVYFFDKSNLRNRLIVLILGTRGRGDKGTVLSSQSC